MSQATKIMHLKSKKAALISYIVAIIKRTWSIIYKLMPLYVLGFYLHSICSYNDPHDH
jgi:hypothetical protein